VQACLPAEHPICVACFKNPALRVNGTLDIEGPKFGKDDTCQLCAPRAQAGGCGGLGPNFVSDWYKGPTGPLTRKAANFTKPMGMTNDEITYSNVAVRFLPFHDHSCHLMCERAVSTDAFVCERFFFRHFSSMLTGVYVCGRALVAPS
jgi:hypothetical protein